MLHDRAASSVFLLDSSAMMASSCFRVNFFFKSAILCQNVPFRNGSAPPASQPARCGGRHDRRHLNYARIYYSPVSVDVLNPDVPRFASYRYEARLQFFQSPHEPTINHRRLHAISLVRWRRLPFHRLRCRFEELSCNLSAPE
jgi:hypothetical protein